MVISTPCPLMSQMFREQFIHYFEGMQYVYLTLFHLVSFYRINIFYFCVVRSIGDVHKFFELLRVLR